MNDLDFCLKTIPIENEASKKLVHLHVPCVSVVQLEQLECSNVVLQMMLTNEIYLCDIVFEFHWIISLELHNVVLWHLQI